MALVTRILLYRGAFANMPLLAQGEMAFATDTKQVYIGDGVINRPVGGARLPDGDYGPITIMDNGETWELNARSVGPAELDAINAQRVLGRNTVGAGDVEEVTVDQLLDWIAGTAAAGDMLIRGASAWERIPATTLNYAQLAKVPVDGVKWQAFTPIVLEDQKASGTDGGSSTAGSWQTRTLNTKVIDTNALCTLAGNAFSLLPGVYHFEFSAPAYNSSFHQCRLRDTVNGNTVYGSSEFNVTNAQTRSCLRTAFTVAAANSFVLEHRVNSSQATNGYGLANAFGGTQVYSHGTITPLVLAP